MVQVRDSLVATGVESVVEEARSFGRTDLRTYVVLGRDDALRTVENARTLVARLSEIGFRCELDERTGLSHEYLSDFAETLRRALDFVLGR